MQLFKIITLLGLSLLLTISCNTSAQKRNLKVVADSIMDEANTLYNSEWASRRGKNIIIADFPEKKLLKGGYFSYENKKELINICFSKDENPVVIATIKFDSSLDSTKYSVDTTTRKFTDFEKEMYTIRLKAGQAIFSDPLFIFYPETHLNVIPIIKNGVKKVYVVTGQTRPDVVFLGNDYLINFDQNNNIFSTKRLHNNFIPLQNGGKIEASSHNHIGETSPFMTATDICIFKLWKLWKSKNTWVISFAVSTDYVSAFHFDDASLEIFTQAEWAKKMKKK